LGSSLIALVVLCLLPVARRPTDRYRKPHSPSPPHDHPHASPLSFEELQAILISTPNGKKAEEWSRYYTAGPHLAGKNYSQVTWTQERWEEFGIKAEVVAYDVYINYPLGHRLALYERSSSKDEVESWKVKFEASLEEDVLEEDPTTGLDNRIPTFHGYSASGNVTAPYVYVNYGTYQDFEDLIKVSGYSFLISGGGWGQGPFFMVPSRGGH
jgi:N-acetylated-alpha-linked acidic dipeptidase